MKCWRSGTASSTPSSPAVVSQTNDCSGVSVIVNDTVSAGGEHVERRQQHAHERGLRRGRAGGLDDVVLPAVVVLEHDAEGEVAEERGDDRDVRSEAELEHDVRVRGAHHGRDRKPAEDGPRRELPESGGLLHPPIANLVDRGRLVLQRRASHIRRTLLPCKDGCLLAALRI